MGRPGIMIYFDIREPLKYLSSAEKGTLLDAMLEYGEQGVVPQFEGMLAMAWAFIQPKIDRDGENYEISIEQKKYAAFCKKLKANGLEKIEIEVWRNLSETERERLLTVGNECNPSTSPSISPSTSSSISPSISSSISPSTSSSAYPSATPRNHSHTGAGKQPFTQTTPQKPYTATTDNSSYKDVTEEQAAILKAPKIGALDEIIERQRNG